MKNIVLIIGARPNFMKAFPVYEALKKEFNLGCAHLEINGKYKGCINKYFKKY